MKKNLFRGVGIFCIALLVLTSCHPSKPTIKIGINAELTGEVPAVGASCVNAAKLFADELNASGGLTVAGTKLPLALVIGDNAGKADQAALVTQRLISQNGVVMMIGPNTSSCAIPAAQIAESLNCLMISPWSTNPRTTRDTGTGAFKKNVYRACFTSEFEIPALAKFAISNLHFSKAAILYDLSSENPNTSAHLFEKSFAQDGGTIVAMETYTTGDRDFSAQLTKIKAANPELIFLPAYYNDAPLIAQQARRLGITAAFLGDNAWSTPEMLQLDSEHYLEGSYLSNHFSSTSGLPGVTEFIAAYQAKYGQAPDDIAALTYDSMKLAMDVIQKAGSLDREKILETMAQSLIFTGVTGPFHYTKGNHDPAKDVIILSIKDGKFSYVMPVQP